MRFERVFIMHIQKQEKPKQISNMRENHLCENQKCESLPYRTGGLKPQISPYKLSRT